MSFDVKGIAHVNLRIPEGTEPRAEEFWCELLGFENLAKPAGNNHPGRWFRRNGFEVHVSPDFDFVPVTRAHTAFITDGLTELTRTLRNAGVTVRLARGDDTDVQSCFVDDPFGNRLEFMTPEAASTPA